ncbi:MAG: GTP cyclohydrolase 1 type 2 [Opitutia bacterium UBA7350]|nr:MAG: GTP cyclohydrolase 1 type 2 [Opitutae bacterium UBA7350]
MYTLQDIVAYCDTRTRRTEIQDFEGAYNGLQIENNGSVKKIAASVDGSTASFQAAIEAGAELLICHHGLFWNPPIPLVGLALTKIKLALDHNLAVYSSHLPLDCHPEIGNNVCLAKTLGLNPIDTFLPYEGQNIAIVAEAPKGGRRELTQKLKACFPETYQAIEYGSESPQRVAILTGSGQSALPHLQPNEIDTLVTGELRQHHFSMAQELGLNLYPCGHYATEVFGVQALAQEVSKKLNLDWVFLHQPCPL